MWERMWLDISQAVLTAQDFTEIDANPLIPGKHKAHALTDMGLCHQSCRQAATHTILLRWEDQEQELYRT